MKRMNEKCTAKLTEHESTQQSKITFLYEHRPSDAWLPSYGLLIIEENFLCPPSASMPALQETDFWDITSFQHV
jgi:hypothetical protein